MDDLLLDCSRGTFGSTIVGHGSRSKVKDFFFNNAILVAKMGHIEPVEIELLKLACGRARCIAELIGIIGKDCLIFRKYRETLKERVVNQRPLPPIETFDVFFESCLQFFRDVGHCYLDWKPANIMFDYDDTLKLIDLGSCCVENVKIKNPRNVNTLFSSPAVMSFHEFITPVRADDHIAICFVYLWILGITLPWAFLEPELKDGLDLDRFSVLVYEMKCFKRIHKFSFPAQIPNQYVCEIVNMYDYVDRLLY